MNRILRSALAVALVVCTTPALAATQYVSDELRINVRTGQGNQYRIIEVIPTGTAVEVLGTEGDWTQVTTPEGNTGWVQAQYLEEEPVAKDRLRAVRDELEQARERIAALESSLGDAEARAGSANDTVADLQARIEELEGRLAEADEGLRLHEENRQLEEQVSTLEDRVSEARAQARLAKQRNRKEWFLIGGGVLLGGILFGIVVTRIPWQRRRDRMF